MTGCAETEYRQSKIRLQHRNWSDDEVQKVAKRQVVPDMTGDMVRAAIGLPDKITREGDTEKWGYAIMVGRLSAPGKICLFRLF